MWFTIYHGKKVLKLCGGISTIKTRTYILQEDVLTPFCFSYEPISKYTTDEKATGLIKDENYITTRASGLKTKLNPGIYHEFVFVSFLSSIAIFKQSIAVSNKCRDCLLKNMLMKQHKNVKYSITHLDDVIILMRTSSLNMCKLPNHI